MSYLVFARKWRPLTFDDVVGQEHITSTLKKAIEKKRVAHAYIFTGTRGVGKTTTARILARALNCEKGPTPSPCGECTSCKNIISGSSFDVLEIDGASNNSVDDIRELRETVGYSSMGGSYRIFVIDEVHMLSKSAFNALLKTLEEPPKNVIFIFATTEPQKIPATIHSRCQRYDFRRIGAEQILDRLVKICTEEKIAFERSALMLMARKADGSMRDALSLLDQVCSFCQDNLTEKEVRSVLGLVGMDIYDTVMNAITSKTPSEALKAVQDVLHQGYDLHEFVAGLEEHLRMLLFARIPGALESRGLEMEPETAKVFTDKSVKFVERDLLRMAEVVRKTETDLKWSAYPRFLVEVMLLKLVYLDNTLSIEKLLELTGRGGPVETGLPDQKKKSELNADESAEVPLYQPPSAAQPSCANEPVLSTVQNAGSFPADAVEVSVVTPKSVPPDTDELQYDPESCEDEEDAEHASPLKNAADVNVAGEKVRQKNVPGDTPSVKESFEREGSAGAQPDIQDLWPRFLETLLRDRPHLGSFLSTGYIASATATSVDLRFASNNRFQYMEVTKKTHREEITRLFKAFYNIPAELHITLENVKVEAEGQNYFKQTGSAATIDDEITREPIIQTVLEVFEGEILG